MCKYFRCMKCDLRHWVIIYLQNNNSNQTAILDNRSPPTIPSNQQQHPLFPHHALKPHREKKTHEKYFGIAQIEQIMVACITLSDSKEKFVPVKILEKIFLTNLPNMSIEELYKRGPIDNFAISLDEATQLNIINEERCKISYQVTDKDVLVKLSDFHSFYKSVLKIVEERQQQPREQHPKNSSDHTDAPNLWFQINNTIVPCVKRHNECLVPISVVR